MAFLKGFLKNCYFCPLQITIYKNKYNTLYADNYENIPD
jgi:hypothetical protein